MNEGEINKGKRKAVARPNERKDGGSWMIKGEGERKNKSRNQHKRHIVDDERRCEDQHLDIADDAEM